MARSHYSSMTGTIEQMLASDPPERLALLKAATYFPFTRRAPAPKHPPPAVGTRPAVNTVLEQDCVDAAIDLVRNKGMKRVGILNMANEYNCGGGFERVGGSQEEYLFRRTSVAASLWPHRRLGDERWAAGCKALPASGTPFYPFTECGGVGTPCVDVISDTSTMKFIPFGTPRPCAPGGAPDAAAPSPLCMLSIAAQDLRTGRHYNKGEHFDRDLTREKFRTACHMAVEMKCDAVVFGPIGCGAFHNPPQEIATIFRQLCGDLSGEYTHAFEHVVYACIKSQRNLDVFAQTFYHINGIERAPKAALKEEAADAPAPAPSSL